MAKQPSGDKKVSKKEAASSGDKKLSKRETESSGDIPPVVKRRKTAAPDERQIKERAHRIWIDEGRPHGRDAEHWERARRELEQEGE